MADRLVPSGVPDDDDDVVVALETARALEDRGENAESARWLQRAAGAARKQGRPERAGELSRLAARLNGTPLVATPDDKFEPLEERQHVLGDEDEFADKTIVDELPRPAEEVTSTSPASVSSGPATERNAAPPQEAPSAGPPRPATRTKPASPPAATSSARSAPSASPRSVPSTSPRLDKPTPVAPLTTRKEPSVHATIRVAVRKSLGGTFEVRPLEPGDELVTGEEEALLVPLKPGTKWS